MLFKKADHNGVNNTAALMQYERDSASCVSVRFMPKKFFGQWMIKKATIELGGKKETVKIKKTVELLADAGEVSITCYGNFMGKTGTVKKTALLKAGKAYDIVYHTPLIVFMSGKLEIIERS